MTVAVLVFSALFGISIGSFLNVVAYRLPRHESLSSPPSRCPTCERQLSWRDNIPVVSWLLLRGRCRYCGTGISVQYPLVELGTGAAFLLVAALLV